MRRCSMLVLLLPFGASCAAQHSVPTSQPSPRPSVQPNARLRTITDTLDARMPALLVKHRVPAAGIALIEDGRIVIARVYGRQGPGTPATERTLFNVASLTKPIAFETILRLVAAGRISLDEPMAAHWVDPDVANDPRHRMLTPRVALSHQTGFPNWRSENAGGRLAFIAEPGTQFTYSGEGSNYVARFVEKKLGQDFESLAQQYVFTPAGMTSTSFSARSWMQGRHAVPASDSGSFGRPEVPATGKWDAANNLSTTVEDYARFVLGVMNEEQMTRALATERLRLHRSTAERTPCTVKPKSLCPSAYGMALGWERFDFPDGPLMLHTGGNLRPDGAGESTVVYYYPGRGRAVVVLLSGRNGKAQGDIIDIIDPEWPLFPFYREPR